VLAALNMRETSRVTCHAVSNVLVDVADSHAATVHFHLIAYEGLAGEGQPKGRPVGIRTCVDEMRRTANGWRIINKHSSHLLSLG
jgi:hypothetical protein